MRVALFVAAIGAIVIASAGGAAGIGQTNDSFVLEAQDTIVAESQGCRTDCVPQGTRRVCRVKDIGCRAVCRTIPQCKPDGMHSIQVCAIVSDRAH